MDGFTLVAIVIGVCTAFILKVLMDIQHDTQFIWQLQKEILFTMRADAQQRKYVGEVLMHCGVNKENE